MKKICSRCGEKKHYTEFGGWENLPDICLTGMATHADRLRGYYVLHAWCDACTPAESLARRQQRLNAERYPKEADCDATTKSALAALVEIRRRKREAGEVPEAP